MVKRSSFLKYLTLIPPFFIMVAIFCFSAQPASESSELSGGFAERAILIAEKLTGKNLSEEERLKLSEKLQFPIRKGAHMTEYAVLGISILIPLILWKETWSYKKLVLVSILLTTFYAATDEVHQLFVLGRSGQISDVLVDGTGAAIGIIFASLIYSKIKNKRIKNEACNTINLR